MLPKFISLIALGLISGAFSGLVGVGGGVIMIPALVYAFGFSQQMAQGTTLAVLIPPVGILAAITYYQKGFIDIKTAALIALGFAIGALFGARLAVNLPTQVLQKIFAVFLLLVSCKMLFLDK